MQDTGLDPFGQTEHIYSPHDIGLDGLDRIELIMDRRCRAGQIVDLIHFQGDGIDEVVSHDLKMGIVSQMKDIFLRPGKKIVQADYVIALIQQDFTKMTSNKPGPSGYQNFFHHLPLWSFF